MTFSTGYFPFFFRLFHCFYCILFLLLPSFGYTQSLLQESPMSVGEAKKAGYQWQKFSFQESHLDFATFLPKNAKINQLPLQNNTIKPGQIGVIQPVFQVQFVQDAISFEDLIFSYRLLYPPSAFKTCLWHLAHDGHAILHHYSNDPLNNAQILSVKLDDKNQPKSAILAYCYARGNTLIAHYFMAHLPQDLKKAEQAVQNLQNIVSIFATNQKFTDESENSSNQGQIQTQIQAQTQAQIQEKKILIGRGFLKLTFPVELTISADQTTKKTFPLSINLIQKLQNGGLFSHLSLWINKTQEDITEEMFKKNADSFTDHYIQSELKTQKNEIKKELISSNSIPGFIKNGIQARSYIYKFIEPSIPDRSTIFNISIIRDRDEIYMIYYHSLRTTEMAASDYFTGTAGDVAYEMLRNSLFQFLKKT